MICKLSTAAYGLVCIVGFCALGCVAPHMQMAKQHLGAGEFLLAEAYLQEGHREDPSNPIWKRALARVQRVSSRTQQSQIQRLQAAGDPYQALQSFGLLWASNALAVSSASHTPQAGEPLPTSWDVLDPLRQSLTTQAQAELNNDLDNRIGRGVLQRQDLRACRQIEALAPSDASMASLCAQWAQRLQKIVAVRAAPKAALGVPYALPGLLNYLQAQPYELLRFVDDKAMRPGHTPQANAVLQVFAPNPQWNEKGWHLAHRQAIHTWVKRRDRRGKVQYQTITLPPDPKDVKKARALGKPLPKAQRKRMPLWDEVHGEARTYRRFRHLDLPYALTLIDRIDGHIIAQTSGMLTPSSQSEYVQFTGDPRAQNASFEHKARSANKAPALASKNQLLQAAWHALPADAAPKLLAQIDP